MTRTRRDWSPRPCAHCGGIKETGRGVKLCAACRSGENRTLAELIADQAKELRMGDRVHRQRFGDTSRTRARTLSLDALPVRYGGLLEPREEQ